MRIVAALGGNALIRRGDDMDVETQRANIKRAVAALAGLAHDHQLVVTHGNGPQVGLLALQAAAYHDVAAYPLDVLGAETEGMIGYLLEQELATELPEVRVATLLTQVVVDPHDPAFQGPTKPIGPLYPEAVARDLAAGRGWLLQPDGPGWRRVVASPQPCRILELATIRLLVDAGVLVVCAGGGGIPVTVDDVGAVRGVEAVIDKDLSAALLAIQLDADRLLLLTDAEAIWTGWHTPQARALASANPGALRRLDLPAGSMGPKAEAACRFVEATGRPAAIGSLTAAAAVLAGTAGTTVTVAVAGLQWRTPPPPAHEP
ncbi:MAG TPA: carbamate kinase [Acidimicrobiales bacterium]|nr:carbamate kinase [Acidimicrobiales bacterium]